MVYKQNTFLDHIFMIRAISPSLRYVVEGFVCTIWISLEPYIIELSRSYKIKNARTMKKNAMFSF